MVIVIMGLNIKKTKCHILFIKLFLIFMLNVIKAPIINGATSANANSNHFELVKSLVNCELKMITASNNIPATDAPVIFDFFVLVISNVFTRKFLITFKNLGTL